MYNIIHDEITCLSKLSRKIIDVHQQSPPELECTLALVQSIINKQISWIGIRDSYPADSQTNAIGRIPSLGGGIYSKTAITKKFAQLSSYSFFLYGHIYAHTLRPVK